MLIECRIHLRLCGVHVYRWESPGEARCARRSRRWEGELYGAKKGFRVVSIHTQSGARFADCSLAKSAVVRMLMRKAGRFKDVVHLLHVDLGRQEYRAMRLRHASVVARGWKQVQGARY